MNGVHEGPLPRLRRGRKDPAGGHCVQRPRTRGLYRQVRDGVLGSPPGTLLRLLNAVLEPSKYVLLRLGT